MNECPQLIALGCPYEGCTYVPDNMCGEKLKQHLQENVIYHAHLQATAHKDMQSQMTSLMTKHEREREERDVRLKRTEDELKMRNEEVDVLKDEMCRLKVQMGEMMNTMVALQQQIQEIPKLTQQVEQIRKDNKKTPPPPPPTTPTTTTPPPNADFTRFSTELSLLNQRFSDLDLRQQLFENTLYDGKLVWKIDNISTRTQQALTGRVTALHSAPAFTHRLGYKFCARLYLNGDGIGRGTHVSLFFVMMKSEYDTRLTWPFVQSVQFRLVNQTGADSDLVESFIPDGQSSSFRKPVKDMNIASGCPKFIEIHNFKNGGYVKDDCIFVEIEVGKTIFGQNTSPALLHKKIY